MGICTNLRPLVMLNWLLYWTESRKRITLLYDREKLYNNRWDPHQTHTSVCYFPLGKQWFLSLYQNKRSQNSFLPVVIVLTNINIVQINHLSEPLAAIRPECTIQSRVWRSKRRKKRGLFLKYQVLPIGFSQASIHIVVASSIQDGFKTNEENYELVSGSTQSDRSGPASLFLSLAFL